MDGALPLDENAAAQLERLADLREQLRCELRNAATPAVARALQTADYYLLIGLGYLGHGEYLFPEQSEPFLPADSL